jgi:hypothetical protein
MFVDVTVFTILMLITYLVTSSFLGAPNFMILWYQLKTWMKNEYRVYENWYPVTILQNVMHVFSKKRYGCKIDSSQAHKL